MSKKRVFKEGFVKKGPNYIIPEDLVPTNCYRRCVLDSLEVVFEHFLVHSPKNASDRVAPVIKPKPGWDGRLVKTSYSTCRELSAEHIRNFIMSELRISPQSLYQVITCVYFKASPKQVKRIRSCLNFTFRQMERSLRIGRPLSLKILQRTSEDPYRNYTLVLRFPLERHDTFTWLRSIASVSFMLLMIRMSISYYRQSENTERLNFIKTFNDMAPVKLYCGVPTYIPPKTDPFINWDSEELPTHEQEDALKLKWEEVRELFKEQRDLLPKINTVGNCSGIQGALELWKNRLKKKVT